LTLIVFDLDGTLLDGYAGISDALGFAMERRIEMACEVCTHPARRGFCLTVRDVCRNLWDTYLALGFDNRTKGG